MTQLLTRNTQVLLKIEASYGVDAVPTAGNMILVSAATPQPIGETLTRDNYRGTISPQAHINSPRLMEFSFNVELKGSGDPTDEDTLVPEIGPLLRSSGFSQTKIAGVPDRVEYEPVSDPSLQESATIYFLLDGVRFKGLGCYLDWNLVANAGEFPILECTARGIFTAKPDDSALLVDGTNTTLPPIVESTSLTMGAYSPIYQSITVTPANNIVEVPDGNSVNGLYGLRISNRESAGSINPLMDLVANNDLFGDWEDSSEINLNATIGSAAGNTIVIDIPKAVYQQPGVEDRDGLRGNTVPFTCSGNDDEIKLTFQ